VSEAEGGERGEGGRVRAKEPCLSKLFFALNEADLFLTIFALKVFTVEKTIEMI
jgi:hypothetical protein